MFAAYIRFLVNNSIFKFNFFTLLPLVFIINHIEEKGLHFFLRKVRRNHRASLQFLIPRCCGFCSAPSAGGVKSNSRTKMPLFQMHQFSKGKGRGIFKHTPCFLPLNFPLFSPFLLETFSPLSGSSFNSPLFNPTPLWLQPSFCLPRPFLFSPILLVSLIVPDAVL